MENLLNLFPSWMSYALIAVFVLLVIGIILPGYTVGPRLSRRLYEQV